MHFSPQRIDRNVYNMVWTAVLGLPVKPLYGFADSMAFSASSNNPAETADFTSPEQLANDLLFLVSLVQLLNRLLVTQPLSQTAQADSDKSVSSQHDLTSACGNGSPALISVKADTQAQSAQQRLSSSSSNSSTEFPKQSTPKAADWQDTELVASRACVLLHWAMIQRVLHTGPPDNSDVWARLVHELLALIQQLIHGHLWNTHLSMTSIFKCGMYAVLVLHWLDKGQISFSS